MICILLFLPVLLGAVVILANSRIVTRISLFLLPLIYITVVLFVWSGVNWVILPGWLNIYFKFDPIGILFLAVMSVVFLSSSIYSIFYFDEHQCSAQQETVYTATMFLFVAAMTGVILSTHLALMWVFVEATTLTSALLIYFEKKKSSLEAAWKYIYICSIGIAGVSSEEIQYEFFKMEGEEVHEVGVGPIHAGIIEPGHFRFSCHGEQIHNLEIELGFQHRGIENLFLKFWKMNVQ